MYNQFPYTYPYSSFQIPTNSGGLLGLAKKFNWDTFLNNTQRTLNVINQAMPIYNQVKPVFRNMGTIFKVMGELNSSAPVASTASISSAASNTPQFFM